MFFLRLRHGEMFQEQCDPQIEGKTFSYGVFSKWMRLGRGRGGGGGGSQYIQEELLHLSESAGPNLSRDFDRTFDICNSLFGDHIRCLTTERTGRPIPPE